MDRLYGRTMTYDPKLGSLMAGTLAVAGAVANAGLAIWAMVKVSTSWDPVARIGPWYLVVSVGSALLLGVWMGLRGRDGKRRISARVVYKMAGVGWMIVGAFGVVVFAAMIKVSPYSQTLAMRSGDVGWRIAIALEPLALAISLGLAHAGVALWRHGEGFDRVNGWVGIDRSVSTAILRFILFLGTIVGFVWSQWMPSVNGIQVMIFLGVIAIIQPLLALNGLMERHGGAEVAKSWTAVSTPRRRYR